MQFDSMRRLCTGVFVVVVVLIVDAKPVLSHEDRDPRRIDINVTKNGFEPSRIPVRQHEQVTLVFTRRTERTCATVVSLQYDRRDPGKTLELKLELNKPTTLTLSFAIHGPHTFACFPGPKRGTIVVD
jgi:plastocyanin domain-containing protein